ncbi:hypothetical protein [Gordonia sp. FQ]|uniref:hypothetical protein n=1 Tax=Gordonia sp. FQ TaxID=3446634 RepID=UPI003F873A3D
MTPRSDWFVELGAVLGRLDSMDPGGAAADGAELARIASAAGQIAGRLAGRFSQVDGLVGDGAVGADAAGLSLGDQVQGAAQGLEPAHGALTSGAQALMMSTASRAQIVALWAFGNRTGQPEFVTKASVSSLMTGVYSEPIGGHADGLHPAAPPPVRGLGPAAAVPGAGGVAPSPATMIPAGTAPAAPAPTAGDLVRKTAVTPGTGVRRGGGDPTPSPRSENTPAPTGGAPGPDRRGGTRTTAPLAGSVPPDTRPVTSGPPAGGRPAPDGGGGRAVPVVVPPVPAVPPGLSTMPRGGGPVPSTSPSSPAAPSRTAPPVAGPGTGGPGGRNGSSPMSPAAGRGGAREDDKRRTPDYLLSVREAVGLIGPLPLAGPAVLGDTAVAAGDAAPAPGTPTRDHDDQDLDFTL